MIRGHGLPILFNGIEWQTGYTLNGIEWQRSLRLLNGRLGQVCRDFILHKLPNLPNLPSLPIFGKRQQNPHSPKIAF